MIIPANINGVAVTKLADGIFKNNTKITSVTFDGSFENYDAKLFQGCTSLRSLVISGVYDKQLYYLFGDSINDIPESFAEITFAENSNYVDGTMFKNEVANHIVTYVIPDGTTEIKGSQFSDYGCMQAVSIPDSVTSIGSYAFYGCSGLTSMTIPDSVTSIGPQAFNGCSGLTSVIIGNGVTSIWHYAFQNCSGLTSVTIPDSVTSIGDYAFQNCSGLTSVTIPDSVISIGSSAFYGCSGLTSVTIPDSVTSIGNSAFIGCSGLTSVIIGNGVTSIGSNAFNSCSGLTNVIIGNGVTSIGDSAFSGCSGLKTVFYKGTAEQWKQISIDYSNFNYDVTLYCYSETEPSLNSYGTAYNGNYWHYDSDGKTPLIWKKETIG